MSADLATLGLARAEAMRAQRDATDRLRAAVLAELGRRGDGHEAEIAREAGVDRMTVRKWAGKR